MASRREFLQTIAALLAVPGVAKVVSAAEVPEVVAEPEGVPEGAPLVLLDNTRDIYIPTPTGEYLKCRGLVREMAFNAAADDFMTLNLEIVLLDGLEHVPMKRRRR